MPETFTPIDPVEIDLGDGKIRHLRYSLGTMRRLRKTLGRTLLTKEALLALDEESIPELIFEGLLEKSDFASSDDIAELIGLPNLKYIVETFVAAWTGSLPGKNAPGRPATPIQ